MPLFYDLDGFGEDTTRIAARLAAIREAMQHHPQMPNQSVPNKNATDTLLLATWNLQAFDGGDADGRTDESYWYIAEIVSHFDLIAIQEVGANLGALEKLKYRLGGTWNYVVSDVTEGKAGNKERLAFLFDRRKIRFSGVAGEIVIPPVEGAHGKTIAPSNQLVRTPTIVGFEAGWFRFMLSTVHIVWGKGVEEHPNRVAEIQSLASFLKDRSEDKHAWSQNLILLGDFNIFNAEPSNAAFSVGFIAFARTIDMVFQDTTDGIGAGEHHSSLSPKWGRAANSAHLSDNGLQTHAGPQCEGDQSTDSLDL